MLNLSLSVPKHPGYLSCADSFHNHSGSPTQALAAALTSFSPLPVGVPDRCRASSCPPTTAATLKGLFPDVRSIQEAAHHD